MALANCEGLRRAGSCAPEGEESQMLASTSMAHHTHQGMQISWHGGYGWGTQKGSRDVMRVLYKQVCPLVSCSFPKDLLF